MDNTTAPAEPLDAARPARALLTDGTAIELRPLGPADRAAVDRLHAELPDDDHYLRFFTGARYADEHIADRVVAAGAAAVGAWRGDRLLGLAHFRPEPSGEDPEIAMVVAHPDQGHGIAALLLEHLVAIARSRGVARLRADVLAVNHRMLRVLRDSGLPISSVPDGDVRHVVLLVPATHGDDRAERYVDAVVERAERAAAAGLRPLLAPSAVAVVGAGRGPGSVGRAVLRSLLDGGYTGAVYAVNPHATSVEGITCLPSVAELPFAVDLAVVCVPVPAVAPVAQECGRRGVRALIVVTSGVGADPAAATGLADAADGHGMRIVGPNCLGVVCTAPDVRLQATFGPAAPTGPIGAVVQSGGVAIALDSALARLGLGVSTAVSVGDAADVNADDLLLWWAQDGITEAAVVHVESLRRPRQFTLLARRLARRIPLIAIRSASSAAGARAAASHTAASATPRVVRDALFAQAGVLAVDGVADAAALLALLTAQPLPAGPRVAVVGNAGGLGVLAADACARAGLSVVTLTPATQRVLTDLLPDTAAVEGPVDTTATVPALVLTRVLESVRTDPGVDAVLVVTVATALGDPFPGIAAAAMGPGAPVVAVCPEQAAPVRRQALPDGTSLAVFADPGVAAVALDGACRRARWLARPGPPARAPRRVDPARARQIVAAAMADEPGGGWLAPGPAAALLRAAGVPLLPQAVVQDGAAAVRAWRAFGRPVAVKADVPGVVHKNRAGGVAIGLDSRHQVSAAVAAFRARFGARLRAIVVQPMAAVGTEMLVGTTSDPLCGPLLTVGLGGTATDLVADRVHCLVPVGPADLDDQLANLRAAPELWSGPDGERRRAAVRDVAARISWLADHLPEVAEAEINPLVVGDDTAVAAVDVRVRLAPAHPDEAWLRTLPW